MFKKYDNFMDVEFKKINREFLNLEADLSEVEGLDKKLYKLILEGEDFSYKKFESLLGVIIKTSVELSRSVMALEQATVDVAPKVSPEQKTAINEIYKKIKETRKYGLTFAERIPFSFGKGWTTKEISLPRKLINVPGYLLLMPFVRGEKRAALYYQSLSDIKKSIEQLREKQNENIEKGIGYNTKKEEKDIKEGLKDFKFFIKNTRYVHKQYIQLHKTCQNLYYSNDIDELINLDKIDKYKSSEPFTLSA